MVRTTDLKYPHTWQERHPQLYEGVFFVPKCYHEHDRSLFPSWSELFGNDHPIHMECCSGNGSWILDKAKQHPESNWVAVEMRFDRVRQLWSKRENEGIRNLLIICGEALTFCRHYVPSGSIQEFFVNFPDPWPKLRHAKNRLFQAPFVEEVARLVAPGGRCTATTDHHPYSEQILRVMRAHSGWELLHPDPYYLTDLPGYGSSYFEELWRSKGCEVRYLIFQRASV